MSSCGAGALYPSQSLPHEQHPTNPLQIRGLEFIFLAQLRLTSFTGSWPKTKCMSMYPRLLRFQQSSMRSLVSILSHKSLLRPNLLPCLKYCTFCQWKQVYNSEQSIFRLNVIWINQLETTCDEYSANILHYFVMRDKGSLDFSLSSTLAGGTAVYTKRLPPTVALQDVETEQILVKNQVYQTPDSCLVWRPPLDPSGAPSCSVPSLSFLLKKPLSPRFLSN